MTVAQDLESKFWLPFSSLLFRLLSRQQPLLVKTERQPKPPTVRKSGLKSAVHGKKRSSAESSKEALGKKSATTSKRSHLLKLAKRHQEPSLLQRISWSFGKQFNCSNPCSWQGEKTPR